MKRACMSNVRDPENRSKKRCVCGGHNGARKRREGWKSWARVERAIRASKEAGRW